MENEVFVASESMAKFFNNLLDLKEFVKKKYEDEQLPILKEIYDKLDRVIKSQ